MATDKMPTLVFPPYMPDQIMIGGEGSPEIFGAVPLIDGYGPFRLPEEFSRALNSPCRGYFYARNNDGTISVFAGTINRLYLLNNTTFQWDDVSKGGIAYGDLVETANWKFKQYNEYVIATQINTFPQKYVLNTSGPTFVDLGGGPPAASTVTIIGRFVVLTGLLNNQRRYQWSDLDAPEVWIAGTGFADFQDFPDGGTILGAAGGDAFGVAFQEDTIRAVVYDPGSSVTFQITKIATNDTLYGEHSIIETGDKIFYLGAQGYKVIVGATPPKPIGKGRVDNTFFRDVDINAPNLIIGAADPAATRVYWAYKSRGGNTGLFDKLQVYDWTLDKWAQLPCSGEYIAGLAKPGLTLEALDAIAPTPLNVLGAANNGAGLIRLTLNALSNADFTIVGQNFIEVYDVIGTTEANGSWHFNIIDATHIDLLASTFVNAYVSGGHIGGSLDALPFSLDSFAESALAALSIFTPNHKAAFFTGAFMEAILETPDSDLMGRVAEINSVRPMTDSPNALVSIGMKMNPQATIAYSVETAISPYGDGVCPAMVETRYARGRLRIPAGSVWSYAKGLQPDGGVAGDG